MFGNNLMVSVAKVKEFQNFILDFYKQNKRSFPWRETNDPYKIMVSEIMLQQTQTYRVLPKYEAFISQFPTIESLATTSLAQVLNVWSGLGYNRRARFLHQAAIHIHTELDNKFPTTSKELQKIPGIGPYTASAVLVFSYNTPLVLIETNIRRVFIHFFFNDQDNIDDKQILPLIEKTMVNKNPKYWYYALMDYGNYLSKVIENPNRKSKHYTKQSKFDGSVRKVRGEIIRILISAPQTREKLSQEVNNPLFEKALTGLMKDQLIIDDNNLINLK
jgi:A/G-specific adenine glycosylase